MQIILTVKKLQSITPDHLCSVSLVSHVSTGRYFSMHSREARDNLKGAVSPQSSSFLFNFANYSPSVAMELEVSKEITCKWQNQRSETDKYVSWALFLKLQVEGINFEKLLGWTVFKNRNFNPFQSSSVLPIRGICYFCYDILTFL